MHSCDLLFWTFMLMNSIFKKWVVFQRVGNEKRCLKWENDKDIYLKNLKIKEIQILYILH